ncbi:MAG TPA: phosphate ABC transporter permease subunit PstC [Spirochaetota bacterium]|nr:MAG: Phosphate transport system permease protein PstC [Spirochaetes bacterium ADurb.Bin218]HOK02890.1 phosphate ABC transporter permease subunit PstC [Spirochaetota bacterium]HOK92361.1 phosphate ABC transporter permease subunit PstC [Spirochaetota bacterium]HON15235.1 phosphate ABC transporter permease subunit PstC [Spirochaetota bacterium]HOV09375.1 phosphate ABC transporter permease subunit PstC [Spirochaetota bacterium]
MEKHKGALIDITLEKFFFVIALSCLLVLFTIMIFLFKEGLPILKHLSIGDFTFGTEWYPTSGNPRFGIFPLIIASLSVTALASLIAIPFSLAVAIYLSEIASKSAKEIFKPMIEIIASIPSVVIGFFGMVVVAPFLMNHFDIDSGLNLFNASIMLAFMVIPIIASISEDAISSVPLSLKEASYALGATRWQTIFHITIPAALSGIWTAIILGISRVIGETMVVLMVAGGAALMPHSFFDPVRPLTSNIAAEMAEAEVGGIHYNALFAIGIILFIITFIFNLIADYLSNKYKFKSH